VIASVRAIFKQGGQGKVPVMVNEVIREALGFVHDELQGRRISVQAELTTGLPPVLGHRGQLQQVILNIVTNAAEAMQDVTDGPRVLRLRSAGSKPGDVLVTIEDSGVGIDPKDFDRIFDAFYTTKPNGMGMGLAICRSIVESHGGRLRVSPSSPRGAIFHMLLPAAEPSGE